MAARLTGRLRAVLAAGVVTLALLICVSLVWTQTAGIRDPLPLTTVATVGLPGHASRFDYADVDPEGHRLFVAHMGDGTLLELDTRTNRVIATITGLPSVTGVIVVPALHRVFASVAGAGQVVTIDEDTGAVLARAPAGQFPDGLAYVPTTNQVWISDETGGAETVLDAGTGLALATVRLGGEAGNVRYDAGSDRLFVDVQTANQIAVIDPHARTITARASVPDCAHDHGLLLASGRAFVACDGNATLVVLGMPDLRKLASLHVGDRPDVLAADPSRGVLYVAAESGDVTTVDLRAAAAPVTGHGHLADNVHVVAVDPTTGRAYFPVPDTGAGHPGLLIISPTPAGTP